MPDIIINGMDMPIKNGCTILTIWPDGTVNAAVYTKGGRSATFSTKTAVQLPEGHGRLGDLDALDRAFTSLRFNADGNLAHWDDRRNWCLHGYEIERLIGEAPTIVPAEGGGEE